MRPTTTTTTTTTTLLLPLVLLVVGLLAAAHATDPAVEFCQNVPPGVYCTEDRRGYYWCLQPDFDRSSLQTCYSGTQCNCFITTNGFPVPCTQSPHIGEHAPCGYPPELPTFPSSYIATQKIISSTSIPLGTLHSNGSATIWLSGTLQKERIDTFLTNTVNSNPSFNTHTQEFYVRNPNNSYTHYVNDVLASSCSRSLADSLPNTGVSSGYFLYNSSQTENTFYKLTFFDSARVGSSSYFTVSRYSPFIPLRFSEDVISRTSRHVFIEWNSFLITEPPASVFTLPAACAP